MHLKQSYYNFIYDDLGENQTILFNARTEALALIDDKQLKQFQKYLLQPPEVEDEFLYTMIRCGYLVYDTVDEKVLIRQNMMRSRYDTHTLSLTIAPTMACNFRCVYCFEQGNYGRSMSDEVMNQLLQFIKNHLNGVTRLIITWFGGEPLLAMPVIEHLSDGILTLCNLYQIEYEASIITNGYMYTKKIAEQLKKLQVQSVQITLDGAKETHDSRKPLANGEGTYDIIVKNLISTKGILPVKLRINIDYDNLDASYEVIQFLKNKSLLNYIQPYLGFVVGASSADVVPLSGDMRLQCNYQFMLKNDTLKEGYPHIRSHYCGADSLNTFVIDDNGYLYKCWNNIGVIKYAIGNVKNELSYLNNTHIYDQYLHFDPTSSNKCKNCKMLPICMGGCPNKRLEEDFVCDYNETYIHNYIVKYAETLTTSADAN